MRVPIKKKIISMLFHTDHSSLISLTGLTLYFLRGSYANIFESGKGSEKFVSWYWNKLPLDLRVSKTVDTLKSGLKTYLFKSK